MTIDMSRALDEVLIPHEGLVQHGYRDTAKAKNGTPLGFFTAGIGNKAADADACANLPWVRPDGSFASADEARACFEAVMALPAGLRASAYADASPLRLTIQACRDLATARINREFLPGLGRLFPHFDGYRDDKQLALLDLIYNLGEGGPARPGHPKADGLFAFTDLRAACETDNDVRAGIESHVATSSVDRNVWRRKMLDPSWAGA